MRTTGAAGSERDQAGSERRFCDRRRRPTRLLDSFRWGGRRRSFRRATEARNHYVDCPSRRVIALSLATVLFSICDGFFTLVHFQAGASEVNPVMSAMLIFGIPTFIVVKTTLTGVGVFILAIHANFRLGWMSLVGAAAGYALLLGYHAILFAGV